MVTSAVKDLTSQVKLHDSLTMKLFGFFLPV